MHRCRLGLLIVAGLTAFSAASLAGEPQARPAVVGHRGLLQAAPENTLAGYRACLALRVGFEFDVRRTKDDELVCLHDETLERTTDGTGRLDALALAAVRQLDAGGWYDEAFRGERVPTVAEILELLAQHPHVDVLVTVDMKDTGRGIEEEVVRLAKQHKVLDRLLFIGATITSEEVRRRLHEADKQAQTARVANRSDEVAAALADDTADWVYVRFLPSADEVARIRQASKPIFLAGPVSAGRETANWTTAWRLGIDGILTDYPLELARMLRDGSR